MQVVEVPGMVTEEPVACTLGSVRESVINGPIKVARWRASAVPDAIQGETNAAGVSQKNLEESEEVDYRICVACDARSVLDANPHALVVAVTPPELHTDEMAVVRERLGEVFPSCSQHVVLVTPEEAPEPTRWAADFLALHFFSGG